MTIPAEVGILTLPNSILFPQALLPLYIFEPRYRKMLKESLRQQRMFAVAVPDGKDKPSRIAGVGLIRACVDKPDGTSNLILQGVSRVRFTDFTQTRPYYVGRIEILQTEEPDGLAVAALGAKTVKLVNRICTNGEQVPDGIMKFLESLKDFDALADIVTYTFIQDMDTKQKILETLNLQDRLKRVVKALENELGEDKKFNFE
jgi:Lon protease-like protein